MEIVGTSAELRHISFFLSSSVKTRLHLHELFSVQKWHKLCGVSVWDIWYVHVYMYRCEIHTYILLLMYAKCEFKCMPFTDCELGDLKDVTDDQRDDKNTETDTSKQASVELISCLSLPLWNIGFKSWRGNDTCMSIFLVFTVPNRMRKRLWDLLQMTNDWWGDETRRLYRVVGFSLPLSCSSLCKLLEERRLRDPPRAHMSNLWKSFSGLFSLSLWLCSSLALQKKEKKTQLWMKFESHVCVCVSPSAELCRLPSPTLSWLSSPAAHNASSWGLLRGGCAPQPWKDAWVHNYTRLACCRFRWCQFFSENLQDLERYKHMALSSKHNYKVQLM